MTDDATDRLASGSTLPPVEGPAGSASAPREQPRVRPGRKRAWAMAAVLSVMAVGGLAVVGKTERHEAAPRASAELLPRVVGDRIVYSEAFAKRVGMRVAPVRSGQLVPVISAVGTIEFDAEHVAAVGTRLRGLVTRVLRFEGDSVARGDALARVESAELGEARAAVGMLEAQREAAALNARREARLAERSLTTAREVEAATVEEKKAASLLSAAKQKVAALTGTDAASGDGALGAHELRAPIAGTVVERRVAPGQFVEGGLVAFKVANLDHLWVELDVFERNLSRIRLGDPTELRPLASASERWSGRVSKISSKIDPTTHSAKVRIEIDNRQRKLRVGQAVQATIQAAGETAGPRPIVPTQAITMIDGKPTVFVVVERNAVRKVAVELGAADEDETEVIAGLADGAMVVVEGALALRSELFR